MLEGARRQESTGAPGATRSASAVTPARGEKIDYGSPEHAGVLHRGRVTEREAELVRADLARANANRAREGQLAIDPADAKERARYGL